MTDIAFRDLPAFMLGTVPARGGVANVAGNPVEYEIKGA